MHPDHGTHVIEAISEPAEPEITVLHGQHPITADRCSRWVNGNVLPLIAQPIDGYHKLQYNHALLPFVVSGLGRNTGFSRYRNSFFKDPIRR